MTGADWLLAAGVALGVTGFTAALVAIFWPEIRSLVEEWRRPIELRDPPGPSRDWGRW